MSELMSYLYEYVLERGMLDYIDHDEYTTARRKSSALAEQLHDTLTKPEYLLFEDYIAAFHEVNRLETEAIFTAAVFLGKEFR